MPSPNPLPRAVRLAVWGNAWARSVVSPDEAADQVRANDPPHVVQAPDAPPEPLILALPPLFRNQHAVALLPTPGFLDGLGGPVSFNSSAVEAGECVVVGGTGLVPDVRDDVVVWHAWSVSPSRHTETFREAALHFRQALSQAAHSLASIDASALRDGVREALVDVDGARGLSLPVDLGPSMEQTLSSALTCIHLTDVALDDHGVDLSTSASRLRRDALQPLDHAARRVLSAASASGPRR